MKNLVAVVPIRKGSQRVKHKNFRTFAKKSVNSQDRSFKKIGFYR